MASPLARNLPKVTQYVKNVGQSVKFSTISYLKDTMPDTGSFIETNQELFRDIASGIKNYKQTVQLADKSIRQSKIYEAGTELKKTLFESIRTGKFYDPKRDAYYETKASGSLGDMDDWGDFDTSQFDVGGNDDFGGDTGDIVSSTVKVATTAQANVIARSSEYLAEVEKASTRLLFAQGEKMQASVNAGFAGTQSMLTAINDFLKGPLTTHMENSEKFFKNALPAITEMNNNLKELTEMHRNLYKREQEKYKESAIERVGIRNPDLKNYLGEVKKNFMDILGPEAALVLGNDMGNGSNMLLALVSNPLKFIPDFFAKAIVPLTVKNSLKSIDTAFSNLFANIIARLNKMSTDNSNPILNYLGRLFGLRTSSKTSVDTGKYEKGPVPFDGVTRKTIIDVIPGHLARIEAALTGATERIFDYETGKWMNAKDLEKKYKERRYQRIRSAGYNVQDDVMEEINKRRKVDTASAKQMEQYYDMILQKIYEDGGVFRPYKKANKDTTAWDYYGIPKEEFLRIAALMVGTPDNPKKGAHTIARSMMEAREEEARYLRDIESKGYSPYRKMFDNSYSFTAGGYTTSGKSGTTISNIFNDSKDKYRKNIFDYLRNINAELMYIRKYGFGGGGGGKKFRHPPKGKGPSDLFDEQLNAELNEAINKEKKSEQVVSDTTAADLLDKQADDKATAQNTLAKEKTIGYKTKNFLDELIKASSLGDKMKIIKDRLNHLTEAPATMLTSVVTAADKQLFKLLFGKDDIQDIKDDDGNPVKSLLDYMLLRVQGAFNKLNDWIDDMLEGIKKKLGIDSFGDLFKKMADRLGLTDKWEWVKDKARDIGAPVVDRLKDKFGWGWNEFKGSVNRTYGKAYRTAKKYIPMTDGDIEDFINRNGLGAEVIPNKRDIFRPKAKTDEEDYSGYNFASGGLITKRGLAVVSPGERIIPVGGKVTQRNNLVSEKAFASRNKLPSGLSFYATGTPTSTFASTEEDINAAKNATKKVIEEVMGDTEHKGIANVIASTLIGGGASLLLGVVGGPLLGAAAGAAFGVTQNSKTAQQILFGDEVIDKDGNVVAHKGGLISNEVQEKFKKYFPSMRDFGIAGGIAGLFTPFGLVGGLMVGSAIGFAKENDEFKDWMYGKKDPTTGERDGGVLSNDLRKKLKKAAPRMLIGAAGAALLGPFGILGNAVLGSGLGLLTTTDAFHNAIFGKEGNDGKKHGGLVQAIYRGLVKPMIQSGKRFVQSTVDYINNYIGKPLSIAVPAIVQMIKNGIIGITDHMKEFLSNMADKAIGKPLHDFLEHTVFANVMKWGKRILAAPFGLAKGALAVPFGALGAIGNNIRVSQIAKGTATDMSAQQRLEFRDKHRFRMFGKEVIGHDKFYEQDKMLAGLKGKAGLARMEQMQQQLKLYLDTRKTINHQVAEVVRKAGNTTSDFFDGNPAADNDQLTIYQAAKKHVNKLFKLTAEGNVDGMWRILNKIIADGHMTMEQAQTYMNKMSPYLNQIIDGIQKQKNSKEYQNQLMQQLGARTHGVLGKTGNLRKFSRMLDKEIDSRKAEMASNPEEAAANIVTDSIDKGTKEIVDTLKEINENLKLNRMTPKERKAYFSAKSKAKASVSDSEETYEDDGLFANAPLGSSSKSAVEAVDNGYHTVQLSDGTQGVADSRGNIMPSKAASKIKKEIAKNEEAKETRRTLMERINDSFFGKAVSGVTGILRGAKDGILGGLSNFFLEHTKAFNLIKWALVGSVGLAAAGHASGWLEDVAFPWLKKTVIPWVIGTKNQDGVLIGGLRGVLFGNKTGAGGKYEGGLLDGFTNWFVTTPVAKFFSGLWDMWQKGGGIQGIIQPVMQWYFSGLEKAVTNIILPLIQPVVAEIVRQLPAIIAAVGKGVTTGIKGWLGGKGNKTGISTTTNANGTVSLTGYANSSGYSVGGGSNAAYTNTFYKDANGNQLVVNDQTGQIAAMVQDENGNTQYVYDNGTVETNPLATFSLAKDSTYSRKASDSSIAGIVGSGVANKFLYGLLGANIGSAKQAAKYFSKKSVGKAVGKTVKSAVTLSPFGMAIHGTSGLLKGAYNATSFLGKTANNLGLGLRNVLNPFSDVDARGVAAKASKTAAAMGDNVASAVVSSADNVVDAATDAASGGFFSKLKGGIKAGTTAVTESAGAAKKSLVEGITKFFSRIAENASVKSLLKAASTAMNVSLDNNKYTKFFVEFATKLADKIASKAASGAVKAVINSLSVIPFATIALAVGYFITGWNSAHTIFGVVKDIKLPWPYKLVAGLVNAVKNALPGIGIVAAFIPTSVIIDIALGALSIIGWDDKNLQKMRDESQKAIDEYNKTADEEDQVTSVEEYNQQQYPGIMGKITNTVKALGGNAIDFVANTSKKAFNAGKSLKNFLFGSNNSGERRRRSGRTRHLYQGDPRLSNLPFGNSTIGQAGCGPIAATNLMNHLAGRGGMDLGTAAQMAIPYQTSDGGTTPNYFTDMLNATGVGGRQTSNKKDLMNSIKNGNPAVLLGNSGTEAGTPFGANNHYISALGVDGNGNIIVEDPDLPNSTYKYPASRVMKDTQTGIIAGQRRRGKVRVLRGFDRGGDPTTTTQSVSNIAVKAYKIIHSNEGDYATVVANDNGAVSIGKLGWHAARAFDIIKKCIDAVGASTAQSTLGNALYSEVVNGNRTSWNHRVVNNSEAKKIGALISTPAGKKIQDMQGYADVQAYIDAGKKRGITDENALVYYADMYNQSPKAANRVADNAKKSGKVTLDTIHQVALSDKTLGKYKNRRNTVYNALKGSSLVGTGTMTLDSGDVALYSGDTGTSTPTFTSQMQEIGLNIMSGIFGDDVVNYVKGVTNYKQNTQNINNALGSMISTSGGTTGSASQQSVVNQMKSIMGKIKYSLEYNKQNPDTGYASCASTVGWAYRKALGVNDMSASSTAQSKDNRFTTIWTNSGSPFNQDSLLQPGDVMYYNWNRSKNNGKMSHTEMYAGNGIDLSHGGPGKGPNTKELNDYRRKHLMMVRRYNGFMNNDMSGSSRRRGYARQMTAGVSSSISSNAKRIISEYGINTSGSASYDGYQQFFAVMVDLLAVIADNTKGLAEIQKAMANQGMNIDTATLEKAAANARKRAARARSAQQQQRNHYKQLHGMVATDISDFANLANSPTGYIIQAMESLATE